MQLNVTWGKPAFVCVKIAHLLLGGGAEHIPLGSLATDSDQNDCGTDIDEGDCRFSLTHDGPCDNASLVVTTHSAFDVFLFDMNNQVVRCVSNLASVSFFRVQDSSLSLWYREMKFWTGLETRLIGCFAYITPRLAINIPLV